MPVEFPSSPFSVLQQRSAGVTLKELGAFVLFSYVPNKGYPSSLRVRLRVSVKVRVLREANLPDEDCPSSLAQISHRFHLQPTLTLKHSVGFRRM